MLLPLVLAHVEAPPPPAFPFDRALGLLFGVMFALLVLLRR